MKKLLIYLGSFMFTLSGFAQANNEYVAMLFSLDGEGEYTHAGESAALMVPQNYMKGDKILLSSGTAILMLFSGDEVILRANEEYVLSGSPGEQGTSQNSSTFQSVADLVDEDHERISQRNAAYRVRGAFSTVKAFPSVSGLIDNSYAEVVLNMDVNPNYPISFEIYDQENDELVWKIDEIRHKATSLKEVRFQPGKNYYWNLKSMDILDMGVINVLPVPEKETLKKFTLDKKIDYLTAYDYYKTKELMFDARHILVLAINRFEESDLFEYLLEYLEIPD